MGGVDVNSYVAAAKQMAQGSWGELDFFRSGAGQEVAAQIDELTAKGAVVLPPPAQVFNALHLTPPGSVRAVILGQDPYPTPGDAHGLAFSVAGHRRKLPMSLRTIFAALENDLGLAPPGHGNLSDWARQGVLLLNTALTVEAGKANAHAKLGWDGLARDVLAHLNTRDAPIVFMLWGRHAQTAGKVVDGSQHLKIETVHPSPLARGKGPVHRFVEARPFRSAEEWLLARGVAPIDWRLRAQLINGN